VAGGRRSVKIRISEETRVCVYIYIYIIYIHMRRIGYGLLMGSIRPSF
jgi:hypothetical protein